MTRWFRIEVSLIIAGIVGVIACSGSSPSPTGGAGGAGGSGSATGATVSTGAAPSACDLEAVCAKCIECARLGPCFDQYDYCNDNTECIAMTACVDSCGGNNPPCEALCEEAHPDGVPAWKTMDGCTSSSCPMSCGAGGG